MERLKNEREVKAMHAMKDIANRLYLDKAIEHAMSEPIPMMQRWIERIKLSGTTHVPVSAIQTDSKTPRQSKLFLPRSENSHRN